MVDRPGLPGLRVCRIEFHGLVQSASRCSSDPESDCGAPRLRPAAGSFVRHSIAWSTACRLFCICLPSSDYSSAISRWAGPNFSSYLTIFSRSGRTRFAQLLQVGRHHRGRRRGSHTVGPLVQRHRSAIAWQTLRRLRPVPLRSPFRTTRPPPPIRPASSRRSSAPSPCQDPPARPEPDAAPMPAAPPRPDHTSHRVRRFIIIIIPCPDECPIAAVSRDDIVPRPATVDQTPHSIGASRPAVRPAVARRGRYRSIVAWRTAAATRECRRP